MVQTLYAVSAISRKHNFQGPFIGKKYAEANKRNFSAEVLAKSKSAVPMMAKGGIAHKNNAMDGMGIVKTDKSMQKPSQVLNLYIFVFSEFLRLSDCVTSKVET